MINPIAIVRLATSSDKNTWDDFAIHPLQSWQWGEFRASMGIDVVRLLATQNTNLTLRSRPELVEGWQITFHKIPHTPWTIGYFPKGPTISEEMISELAKLGKQKNAIFIQLEPNVENNSSFGIHHSSFLHPAHHPLFTKYTFMLDLTKSEDELLKAMHPKTRYNIKVAQKHGVVVKEDNSGKAFKTYLKLSSETTHRQGFFAHNERYHQTMWDTLSKNNIAHLWSATYQKETLASWIIFTWKDILYYPYGTSSRGHKEVMAPYLLLWEIVKWGKQNGYKKFDLWGALGPNADEHDPWYGFHRFKEGFSPKLVELPGSYDLVINPTLYTLYKYLDILRWTILKITKKF